MVWIDDNSMGKCAKNRELKVLIKVLNINGYLFIMKLGLEDRVVRGYDEFGKKFVNEIKIRMIKWGRWVVEEWSGWRGQKWEVGLTQVQGPRINEVVSLVLVICDSFHVRVKMIM